MVKVTPVLSLALAPLRETKTSTLSPATRWRTGIWKSKRCVEVPEAYSSSEIIWFTSRFPCARMRTSTPEFALAFPDSFTRSCAETNAEYQPSDGAVKRTQARWLSLLPGKRTSSVGCSTSPLLRVAATAEVFTRMLVACLVLSEAKPLRGIVPPLLQE